MAEAKAVECPICCEPYNKSTRKEVCCEYSDCNYSSCKGCVRQYLLSTTMDPHCMNCKKAWNQKFLIMNLNKSFISKDYLTHRKQLLLEKEIAKLPDVMDLATRTEKIIKLNQQSNDINKEIRILSSEFRKVVAEYDISDTEYYNNVRRIHDEIYVLRNRRERIIDEIYRLKEESRPTEKKKFIMGCANPECRGFLSTSYKCELCEMYTCSNCLEFIRDKKGEHVCNEDNVKTAEIIKKETKPCPKCGERIYKIDGCDQMWCSQCHTTFDWVSGRIDNGVIHNPHFFEYQRTLRDNTNPQAFGQCNPMNIPDWYLFYNSVVYHLQLINSAKTQVLVELYRLIVHITEVELRDLRNKMNETQDTTEIRVDYILKRIDKKMMATRISQKDKARQKLTEIFNIYQLISTIGRELLHNLTDLPFDVPEVLESTVTHKTIEFTNLVDYCNEQFAIIGATYDGSVPFIAVLEDTYNWQIHKKHYTMTEVFEKSRRSGSGCGSGSSNDPIELE